MIILTIVEKVLDMLILAIIISAILLFIAIAERTKR